MRRRTFFAVAVSAMLAIGVVMVTSAGAASGEAIVCHATGSSTNPFNLLVVDSESTVFEGHLSHEGDIIAEDPTEEQLAEAKAIKEGESDQTPLEFCLSLVTTTTTAPPPTTTTPPVTPPTAPPAEPVPGEPVFTG